MPLTQGAVTIKLAGGTYSTWAAFWDDLGNLDGNITCTVDASAFTEGVAPLNVTESLGGFILHVLPTSFPTATDASDGARFTFNYVSTTLGMRMEGPGDLIIEGIVFIEGTSEPSSAISFSSIGTEFDCIIRRNICKGLDAFISQGDSTLNAGLKIYNNILYDITAGAGILINAACPDAVIANNTVQNCQYGFSCGNFELTIKNNLTYGAAFRNIGGATIGNNNADSDNTGEDADWGGGGANNVPGIADPFNNLAADDFTITALGDIGTAGLDLSGDFTTDFFGVTRINWTIGAYEYVTPSGPSIPVVMNHYRRLRG